MTIRNLGIFLFVLMGTAFLIAAAPLSPPDTNISPETPEESADLVPHRASYRIHMVSRETGSQVLNVSGNMDYEWQPDCDAWTTDHVFELYYEYTDSMPVRVSSNFSTYETFDGELFSFSVTRRRSGRVFEELRGQAVSENGDLKAVYTKPDGLTFDLPEDTYFPSAHTKALAQKIATQTRFFNATVYDGSDDTGPVEINSFIGSEADALAMVTLTDEIDQTLLESPAHNVRMAFFPVFEDQASADYEMDAVFHQNGVISDMKVDYKEFSVTQELISLEKIDLDLSCETDTEL